MDKALIFCMAVLWNMFILAGGVYLIIKYNAWWVIILLLLLGYNPLNLKVKIRYKDKNTINSD